MRKVNENIDRFEKDLKLQKLTVKQDVIDRKSFEELRENNARLKHSLAEMKEDYPQFDEMQQDIFSSLYKYKPKLVDVNRVKMEYLLNHAVMDEVMQSPKYKELRSLTKLDRINASIGAEVLTEEVKELIKKLKEQFEEMLAEQDDMMGKDGGEAQEGEEGEGEGEKAGEVKSDSDPISLEEAQKRLQDHLKKSKGEIKKELKKKNVGRSLEKAIEKTKEVTEMIRNWGLDQDETFEYRSYEEKLELLDQLRNSPKLKQIADLAGRMKRLALNSQHTKIKRGTDEIYDITQGGDIGRIIPSELMKFRHPIYKRVFMKDLTEGTLFQYEYRGKEKKAKGPIVCCIDSSGSMSGQSEIWSKAVAMALLDIARAQKRSFHVIHFSSSYYHHSTDNLHTNTFLKDDAYNIEEVIDMATYFIGGGTQFEPPLNAARDCIDLEEKFSKADIVFVTDGEAAVTPQWNTDFIKWKKERKVSVFSIIIDSGYGSTATLDLFSTSVQRLSSINDYGDTIALSLFDQF
jgi:uncharacterized protein with von Willebrand factor type A (vWA) domain